MGDDTKERSAFPQHQILRIGGGHPLRVTEGLRILDPDNPTKKPSEDEPIVDPARWLTIGELEPYKKSLELLPFRMEPPDEVKYDPIDVRLSLLKESREDGEWTLDFDFGKRIPFPIVCTTEPVTAKGVKMGPHKYVQVISFETPDSFLIEGKPIKNVSLHHQVALGE
jgi:hypothetical protein